MATIAWVLFWVLIGIVVLIITALATPVKLDITLRSAPTRRFTAAARIFGGLTPPINLKSRKQKRTTSEDTGKPVSSSRTRPNWTRMITAAPDLIRGLIRPLHIESLEIDADIGLEDPADTGQVYGMLLPFIYALPPSETYSIALRPDFGTQRLDAKLDATVSFIPLAFVPPASKFAWRVFAPQG